MSLTLYKVLNAIINIVMAIITFFLGLRILLRLFAANPSTPFVQWIYSMSEGLMAPFRGIFPNATLSANATFDISAFIALIAYAVVFYLVSALVRSVALPHDEYIMSDRPRTV